MKDAINTSLYWIVAAMLCCSSLEAQDIKVVLTGNTADLEDQRLLFWTIDHYCQQTPNEVVWVLNGDVFHELIPEKDVGTWLNSMNQLLDKHEHLTLLINQGEREWKNSARDGWQALQRLEQQVSMNKHPRLNFFFEKGCPGPWLFSVSPFVDIIVFNSQWWNHPHEKPLSYMNACGANDENIFLEKMNDLIAESKSKNILLLSHFPLLSLGKYGGHFPISSYLLPPVLGSARTSYRQNIGTTNDISNANFEGIRKDLLDMTTDYSSLIHASGHERNHSVIKDENNYYINSGALEEGDFTARSRQALLSTSNAGFIELTYDSTGGVTYCYFEKTKDELVGIKKDMLVRPWSIRKSVQTSPAHSPTASSALQPVAAGPEYNAGKWKRLWLGNHYRYSWSTPVTVPELNMDTTFQGLTILRKGGGRQTTSLKLIGGDGREYVFRSVNKDPSKALSRSIRGTVLSRLIKDQTSTQQPYGALATSYLLDRINILHARPRLYTLPSKSQLGAFSQYENMMGMLEDSPSDKIKKDLIFGDADYIERSHKLFQKLFEDHDNSVDRFEFCKARVFDILVGDWGKHEDNWKWAGYKKDGSVLYRPIPRDRDHVFSLWDGVIPFLVDREWAKETGEDFDYTIKGLRSLMHQARHMDRLLGNQLTKEDWINAAKEIQKSISDTDIDQAMRKMPDEIYEKDGAVIAAKLKARVRDLPNYAQKYYAMLSREVDVVGSNKAEYFQATRNSDASVTVMVCDLKGGKPDLEKVYFTRRFIPEETEEIRLYGLTNDDIFKVDGESKESMVIRIIHGDDKAVITDSSFVKGRSKKTKIYQKEPSNLLYLGKEGTKVMPKDRALFHYQRTAFEYNTYFPLAFVIYNPFTGLALNTQVSFTNHNFSKPDFSTRHTVSASVSTRKNFEVSYKNQLRYLIGKWDGISEINLSRPLNYNYFFGIGNDTENIDEFDKAYYRAQYNSFQLRAGLTRSFWKKSNMTWTASYESAEGIKQGRSFLSDNPDIFGLRSLDMVGLKATLDLDFRDDPFLPERGFRLGLSGEAIHINNSQDNIASIAAVKIEHFLSTYNRNPITLGIAAGSGWTSGELPFYKLFSLGQLNDLHGFKRNRYTGDSKAYLNTEIRWQIVETQNNFIPVKVGLRTFYDVGRVWAKSDPDSAHYWHQGYGAGFYVTPFMNQFSLNVNLGFSKEEPFLLMFGIGGFL